MRSSFEKWCLLWETVPEKNIQKYAFCQSTLITESYCHMIILNRCQPWSANRKNIWAGHYPNTKKSNTFIQNPGDRKWKIIKKRNKMKTERGSKGRDGLWTFLGSTLRLVTNAFLLLSVSLFDPSVHLGFRPCPLLGQQSHFLVGSAFSESFWLAAEMASGCSWVKLWVCTTTTTRVCSSPTKRFVPKSKPCPCWAEPRCWHFISPSRHVFSRWSQGSDWKTLMQALKTFLTALPGGRIFSTKIRSKFVPILPQPVPHHQSKSRKVMKCLFETQVFVQGKGRYLDKIPRISGPKKVLSLKNTLEDYYIYFPFPK